MPELPDLTGFAINLNKYLAGKKLEEIDVKNRSKLKISLPELRKEIEGSKLKEVYREGKELHFSFSNGNVLGMHLMLRGELDLFEKKNEKKSTIVEMHFEILVLC